MVVSEVSEVHEMRSEVMGDAVEGEGGCGFLVRRGHAPMSIDMVRDIAWSDRPGAQ